MQRTQNPTLIKKPRTAAAARPATPPRALGLDAPPLDKHRYAVQMLLATVEEATAMLVDTANAPPLPTEIPAGARKRGRKAAALRESITEEIARLRSEAEALCKELGASLAGAERVWPGLESLDKEIDELKEEVDRRFRETERVSGKGEKAGDRDAEMLVVGTEKRVLELVRLRSERMKMEAEALGSLEGTESLCAKVQRLRKEAVRMRTRAQLENLWNH